MELIEFIFTVAVLIISVIVHEVSHGYAAERMGDPTARLAGRLTLNPYNHMDMVGSFIVPTLTFFLGGIIFGWAKPVPYNPHNLSNQRFGPAIVAAAGPFSNFFIAFIFGLLIQYSAVLGLGVSFILLAQTIVFVNVVLGFFNLLPIPPLDGSKILFSLLPYRYHHILYSLDRFGFIGLLIFVFFFWHLVTPLIYWLAGVFMGGF